MEKKRSKKIISVFASICLLCALFAEIPFRSLAVSEQTQEEIDRTEQEKEALERKLEEQRREKERLEDSKLSAEEKLEKLKKEYESIASDLTKLEEEQAAKAEEIVQKEAQLQEAVETQERQYEDMKKRIRYLYEQPQESLLAVFLKDFDMAEALNRADHIVKIQEYDRAKLKSFEAAAKEVERQKQELEKVKQELDLLVETAKKKQTEVAALQKKTGESIRNYLDKIGQSKDKIGGTQDALEEKSAALKKLYKKAQAEEEAERRRQAEEAAKELQDALENGTINPGESGIVPGELTLTPQEMDMLTAMIYCESRGEPYEGQLAVGYVIMNRVRSTKFPGSLEAVLRQNRQFEPAGSGRFDIVLTAYREEIPGVLEQKAWESCRRAAEECVNGTSNVGESLFFRTHAPVPQLAENLAAAGVPYWIIQNHIFYYSWVNY